MPGGAHSRDLGHGRSQGRGPEWDNGNGASHLSPLLEHHRRASGGRSRVCLRAEFVLKRFIISLTGRFPASVLVNNCSQLNVRKICIAGVRGGLGGHEENFLPAHAWCGDTTGVAWLRHMAQGWQRGGMGRRLQRVPHPKPSAWGWMGIALLRAPRSLLCSLPLHSLPSLQRVQALPGSTSRASPAEKAFLTGPGCQIPSNLG